MKGKIYSFKLSGMHRPFCLIGGRPIITFNVLGKHKGLWKMELFMKNHGSNISLTYLLLKETHFFSYLT